MISVEYRYTEFLYLTCVRLPRVSQSPSSLPSPASSFIQMSNKRSNSFRRAILQGSRQLRGCSLRDEVGLGLSQRLVRHVAYETLPREVDRKWYFDSYTYCPPPWLILTITIAEVTQTWTSKSPRPVFIDCWRFIVALPGCGVHVLWAPVRPPGPAGVQPVLLEEPLTVPPPAPSSGLEVPQLHFHAHRVSTAGSVYAWKIPQWRQHQIVLVIRKLLQAYYSLIKNRVQLCFIETC